MSSYSFEIALFGEFFPKDLKSIMNRIALHSDSAQQMHSREIVFEPLDINQQREQGQEPVLLRARKELLEPDSGWYGLSLLCLRRISLARAGMLLCPRIVDR